MDHADTSLEQAKREIAVGYDFFYKNRPNIEKPKVSSRVLEFNLYDAAVFMQSVRGESSQLIGLGDGKYMKRAGKNNNE
jgi:hypothetical protein